MTVKLTTSNRRHFLSLRMAPMIDMIFLLLIFFVVAAKWRPQEDLLPFKSPQAQAQAERLGLPEPLTIQIHPTDDGCAVVIGTLDPVAMRAQTFEADITTLMTRISDNLNTQKRIATDPIEIICAPEVKWEYIAKIYNAFFGSGLTDITFRITQ